MRKPELAHRSTVAATAIVAAMIAIVFLLEGRSHAESYNTEMNYLKNTAELFGKSDRRADLTKDLFVLYAFNAAAASDDKKQVGDRMKDLQTLAAFGRFLQEQSTQNLESVIGDDTAKQFAQAARAYDKFAQTSGLIQTRPIYESGKRALALSAMGLKLSFSPIKTQSLCDCFFMTWICKAFS